MPKRTASADEANPASKRRNEQILADFFGSIVDGMPRCPLLKLTSDQLMRVLAAPNLNVPTLKDEGSNGSSEDDGTEDAPAVEFVLAYQDLANLALSCRAFSLFMLKKEYRDGFDAVARLRGIANGIEDTSFNYLPRFASEVINPVLMANQSIPEETGDNLVRAGGERIVNHLWSPLIFYLNTVGFPPCRYCGMKTDLRGRNGAVPISTFVVIRGGRKHPREPLLTDKDKESHCRVNRAILKSWRRHVYRCIDPSCAKELDIMLLNTPLGTVFDACLATAPGSARHHDFKSQKFQLYKANGEELDFSVKFCKRCGVLHTAKENLDEQVKCGGQCKSARQRLGLDKTCVCARPCTSCKASIRSCRCTFCEECSLCQGDDCTRCKKTCECEEDYCDECGCEPCECL